MLELRARPLRSDRSRILAALVTLPGLAVAASHAPLALLTFGPLIGVVFALTFRERYLLDRARLLLCSEPPLPGLEVRYRERVLAALDLRYARRNSEERAELLYEPGGAALLIGEDPPPEAAWVAAPRGGLPLDDPGTSAPLDDAPLPAELLLLRVSAGDLDLLRAALAQVPSRPPPREDQPGELLAALGALGVYGPRAEAALRRRLAATPADERPAALRISLQELALRDDRAGAAARRLLGP